MLLGGATFSGYPPQLRPLIQIWSLLPPKNQDGGSCKAKLEGSKVHKLVGDVTTVLHSGQKL